MTQHQHELVADQLVADLHEFGEVRQGESILRLEGSVYRMCRERGRERHQLLVEMTTADRLLAHWEGFCGRKLA